MRKNYRFFTIAFLLLVMAINMVAQTTAYVALRGTTNAWKEGNGWNGCVFAFDTKDPSTVTNVVFKLDVFNGAFGEEAVFVLSGTSADDKYYAMCESEYAEYNDEERSFCTLNFETGKKTILGKGYNTLNDMAYDATTKTLYGIEYKSDNNSYYSSLSSIHKGTGELTPVYDIPEIRIVGIASDGNQKLYGIGVKQNQGSNNFKISLYLIDPTKKETKELHHEIGEISASSYAFTLDFHEGTLYLIAGKDFITIEPQSGTMEISEKKLPSTPLMFSGLCFTKSTADGTGEDTPEPPVESPMKVRVVETWGDAMGDETGCTAKEVTYYDADNKPMRMCVYGKLLGKDIWQISRFRTYAYNDQKQLVRTSSEQYGVYEGEDYAFKASADTITYEYDGEGRMTKETTLSSGGYIAYEYDEAGNLAKKIRYNPDRYNEHEGDYYVMESYEYSDFIAPDCPQTIKGDGFYESYKTLCKVTYNSNNNKTSAKTYDVTGKTLRKSEYWTYKGDMLVMYEDKKVKKIEDGGFEELDNKRTVYSLDNENPNRIKKETFSYFNGEWGGVPYYYVTEMANYDGSYSTDLEIKEVVNEVNTVKLIFTVPNIPTSGSFAFDIYRHGIKIARILPSDEGAFDPDTQTLSYIDKEVKNGVYDYFVQTVILSEMGDEEEAFNISNVVEKNIFTELPAVTNVHYVSHRTENNSYLVTVGWDAPEEVAPELGFQRYNVFIKGFKAAENREDDGQPTTYEINFGDISLSASKEKEIIIESVFKYGKIRTEPTLISIKPTGIKENEWSGIIQRNGDKIFVNKKNVSVDVISPNGVIVNSYQNAECVDLSALDSGIYLIKMVYDGKVQVVKLIK